jgi:hypothetical protein
MPSGLRPDLTLVDGPLVPDHVTLDRDGVVYATTYERDEQDLPARFAGPARPDDDDGPPWATLVFGLETGRFDLRERFVEQLHADAAAGLPLERYGAALGSAFNHIFGGRGATHDEPGFDAFVRAAIAATTDAAVRTQLQIGLREHDPAWSDPRFERAGASALAFPLETGHVPADHPSVLYWMSALVPGWTNVLFDQISSEVDEIEADPPHQLEAWWAGYHFRAPAENRGDFLDPWSCCGLINVILRDAARSDIRLVLDELDDTARVVAAPRSVLRALRDLGLIGPRED